MEKLKKKLNRLIEKLENAKDFRDKLDSLISVYPFNEYEYIISHLLAGNKLTIDEYYELRNSYIDGNLYLYIFEISAPRGLGDKWAFGRIKELASDFKRPSKKLDPNYSNEYDFWFEWRDRKDKNHKIRIEVKTSRAVDFEKPDEPLYVKALASDSDRPFDMNFQQIKIRCADIFLWIAARRDKIKYWVLNSQDAQNNRYFSKGQHRGNVGEGQLHLNQDNISDFNKFQVQSTNIKEAVIDAYKRLKKIQ